MHLSETAFLAPRSEPGAYDLRWFTPTDEVDLCGHATLASSHVLWDVHGASMSAPLTFHTRSGVLKASRAADGTISLDFPSEPATEKTRDEYAEVLVRAFGLRDKSEINGLDGTTSAVRVVATSSLSCHPRPLAAWSPYRVRSLRRTAACSRSRAPAAPERAPCQPTALPRMHTTSRRAALDPASESMRTPSVGRHTAPLGHTGRRSSRSRASSHASRARVAETCT